MPVYPYACVSCGHTFDVVKRVAEYNSPEPCQSCGGAETKRTVVLVAIEKSSAVQPYYEPALGTVINSKGHKARILKERGLEEVGNTSPDTMYKDLELQREKRLEQKWEAL